MAKQKRHTPREKARVVQKAERAYVAWRRAHAAYMAALREVFVPPDVVEYEHGTQERRVFVVEVHPFMPQVRVEGRPGVMYWIDASRIRRVHGVPVRLMPSDYAD